MEEDKGRTADAMKNSRSEFSYPGIIYVEYPGGLIEPVIVVLEPGSYVEYSKGQRFPQHSERFRFVKSALLLSPSSQSDGKLFVLDGATSEDLQRVLSRASEGWGTATL